MFGIIGAASGILGAIPVVLKGLFCGFERVDGNDGQMEVWGMGMVGFG